MHDNQEKPRISQAEIAAVSVGAVLGSIAMMTAGARIGESLGGKWGGLLQEVQQQLQVVPRFHPARILLVN